VFTVSTKPICGRRCLRFLPSLGRSPQQGRGGLSEQRNSRHRRENRPRGGTPYLRVFGFADLWLLPARHRCRRHRCCHAGQPPKRLGASPSPDSDRSHSRVSQGYLSRTFGSVGTALPNAADRHWRHGAITVTREYEVWTTSNRLEMDSIVANYLPTEIIQRKNRFDSLSRLVQEVLAQHTNQQAAVTPAICVRRYRCKTSR